MLSRKSKDKAIKEGIVGKYVKIETPPVTGKRRKVDVIFAFHFWRTKKPSRTHEIH